MKTSGSVKTTDTSFLLSTEFGLSMSQIDEELLELRDQVQHRRELKTAINKVKELVRNGDVEGAKTFVARDPDLAKLVGAFPEPTKVPDGPGYYERVTLFGVTIDPNRNDPASVAARPFARFVQPTKDEYSQEALDKFLDTLTEKGEEIGALLQEDTLTAQVLDQRKGQLFGLRTALSKSHHDSIMSAINKIA